MLSLVTFTLALLLSDPVVGLKVVNLEGKANGLTLRGPAKAIRNVDYDTLDHGAVFHPVHGGTSEKIEEPATPAFMRFADAGLDLVEWKSSMFCTQIDLKFPMAVASAKLQIQLNIGIMGQTSYNANAVVAKPALIKGEFMVGLGASLVGGFGSFDISASLYVQGTLKIESFVPAQYYMSKDLKTAYPLMGTIWAVKQWALNKLQNSPLYKWYKNKKKEKTNAKMSELLVGIHKDFEGAHLAEKMTDCDTWCKGGKSPTPCAPVNPTCPKGVTCSKVSKDCDSRSSETRFTPDYQMDSAVIKASADLKFIEFIDALKAKGNELFTNMASAYAASDTTKPNAYRAIIEKIWRKVYLGKEEADVTKLFGKTLYTHRINCQAIPGCYKFGEVGGVHTLMGSDAKLAIMPLMCAWMKYGGSLEVPKTGWIFVDGKGNQNLKDSLLMMYPELFPVGDTTKDAAWETWISRMATNGDSTTGTFTDNDGVEQRSSWLGGYFDKVDHGLDTNAFKVHAVHDILSLPPDQAMAGLEAIMDDIADAAKEFNGGAMAAKGCLPTKEGCCGIRELELSATAGMTVGSSVVGFCTPDTNPFQKTTSTGVKWGVDEAATIKGGVGHPIITERKGYCFLGNAQLQARETTITGVIPFGPSNFIYINYFSKANWALTSYTPHTVGVTISFLTSANQMPMTLALSPACVVLQAIWQTVKQIFNNMRAKLTGKPTKKIVYDLLSETRKALPSAVSDYCKDPLHLCESDASTKGKEILKYIATIGNPVDIGVLVDAAGKLLARVLPVSITYDTYMQIDAKITLTNPSMCVGKCADGKTAKAADRNPLGWALSTEDGDTGMTFGMQNIGGLAFTIPSVGGMDIGVAGYMGSGTSVECSNPEAENLSLSLSDVKAAAAAVPAATAAAAAAAAAAAKAAAAKAAAAAAAAKAALVAKPAAPGAKPGAKAAAPGAKPGAKAKKKS